MIYLTLIGMLAYTDFFPWHIFWITAAVFSPLLAWMMFFKDALFFQKDEPHLSSNTQTFTTYSDFQIIFIKDSQKVLIECSESLVERYGLQDYVMIVKEDTFASFVHPDDRAEALIDNHDIFMKINANKEVKFRIKLPGASDYILMFRKGFYELDSGFGYVAFDITNTTYIHEQLDRKSQTINALLKENETVLENAHDLIVKMDKDANIIYASKEALRVYEAKKDDVLGQNALDLNESVGRFNHNWYETVLKDLEATSKSTIYINEKEKHIKWRFQAVLNVDKSIAYILAIGHEITHYVQMNDRLRYEKNHDPLTGLLNRIGLFEFIESKQPLKKALVYVIDLKSFSQINNYYGHQIGDALLKSIGTELKGFNSDDCAVARYASDEFVIVCLNDKTDANHRMSLEKSLQKMMVSEHIVPETTIQIRKNIGCAFYPEDTTDIAQLIPFASLAMKNAEKHNLSTILRYKPKMHTQLQNNVLIASKLKDAIENDELEIYFQSILDVESNQVIYLEGLARWFDKTLGHVAPDTFITAAQASNLIGNLEPYLVKKAIQEFAKIKLKAPFTKTKLALNLTPESVYNPRFSDVLLNLIEASEISKNDVIIEISEKTFVNNVEHSMKHLHRLKTLGFEIALDDFGKDYSSLAVLEKVSFDVIKIDALFTKNIELMKNQEIVKMVRKITNLSHKKLIIEGVETEKQKDILLALGCNYQQGFLFDKPKKMT